MLLSRIRSFFQLSTRVEKLSKNGRSSTGRSWVWTYVGSLRESALRKELSKYATYETNPLYQEVIAECFSEWYTSDEPRQFCELFYERRERYEHERPSKKSLF